MRDRSQHHDLFSCKTDAFLTHFCDVFPYFILQLHRSPSQCFIVKMFTHYGLTLTAYNLVLLTCYPELIHFVLQVFLGTGYSNRLLVSEILITYF